MSRRPFPLLVVGALALVRALAFASPSDPTWLAGVYDAADGDDVVAALADADGVDGIAGPALATQPPLARRIAPPDGAGLLGPSLPVFRGRGPPPA